MVFPHEGGVELFFGRIDPVLGIVSRLCCIAIGGGGGGGGGRGGVLIGTGRRG